MHVHPADDRWEVRRDGQRFAASAHQTRWSAIKNGRLMAEESGSALHIHELDGSVCVEERNK